ncbi:hypothetical protein Tco_0624474 [Tanacetum coccineum]|uniref:Uncharacterized protein n=1 Tax=Tanacetum coccineum TaxID=301880 RepID=A0ABQ4WE19_9ASTR
MSNLKFAETHNLVAFLEKPKESDGFEGIIDFLNTSSIRYALKIQALIDRKKVIVTKMSVRRALQLKDAEGTESFFLPQWKFLIHTILQCLSAKTTAWNEFSSTMASAIILFLDKQVEGMTKHKEIYVTPSHTKKVIANMKRGGKGFSGRVTPLFQTMIVQAPDELESVIDEAANEKHVPTHSNDPLLSVLDLENTKTSQAAEITKLKERVKKLERRNKSRTPGLKRLRKVGRTARIESFEDEGLGAQEDAFKQGRKIADLDADAEEVEVEKAVSTAEVTTIKAAKPKAVTTAATTTTTAVTRPKAIGVVVQEPSEFRTTTSSSQTSQLPQAKDKGKATMIEPEKPLKKKDQILIDEEIAQKLQAQLNAEFEEEVKLAKQREEDANIAEWDNSKLFVELMDKRKKHFARLRAEEQRRKPPTKAQRRNQMCTYLKNMAGFTHSQLKNKSFNEVQKAFDKTMGWIDSFVSMDSEVVKGGKGKDEGSVTRAEECSSKRAGTELEQERIKKQKIDDDQEEVERKKHMQIVVDEEEIAVDAIPLATKPPIIVG